jgi:copper(I)-binding protein
MRFNRLIAGALFALATSATHAQDYKAGAITIDHPYARATGAGQSTGGGYMKLVNGGATDRLVAASADVSKAVELHEMKMAGDVMKMRQVDAIALQAGQTVELKPGGYHVMFIGLKAPLKAGDSFPVKLKFERAGEVTVDVKVQAAATMDGMKH